MRVVSIDPAICYVSCASFYGTRVCHATEIQRGRVRVVSIDPAICYVSGCASFYGTRVCHATEILVTCVCIYICV